MKLLKILTAGTLALTILAAPATTLAAEKKKENAKPYPLKTCLVSDEKLGEHGDPYVFVKDGQEIKMCCKSCLKDFKKDEAKYLKKMEEEAKKQKK